MKTDKFLIGTGGAFLIISAILLLIAFNYRYSPENAEVVNLLGIIKLIASITGLLGVILLVAEYAYRPAKT